MVHGPEGYPILSSSLLVPPVGEVMNLMAEVVVGRSEVEAHNHLGVDEVLKNLEEVVEVMDHLEEVV